MEIPMPSMHLFTLTDHVLEPKGRIVAITRLQHNMQAIYPISMNNSQFKYADSTSSHEILFHLFNRLLGRLYFLTKQAIVWSGLLFSLSSPCQFCCFTLFPNRFSAWQVLDHHIQPYFHFYGPLPCFRCFFFCSVHLLCLVVNLPNHPCPI